jgi:hypothetical protein
VLKLAENHGAGGSIPLLGTHDCFAIALRCASPDKFQTIRSGSIGVSFEEGIKRF